jgi:hypothetical protein
MRIRWNSIVTVAAVLAVLVFVQVMPALQAPPAGQGGGGRGQGGGAAAPGAAPAGAPAGGQGRGGGGGRGGGRGAAVPAGPAPRLANGKPDLSGHWANPYTNNMAASRGATSTVLDPTQKNPDGTYAQLKFDHQGENIAESKGVAKTFDLPYTDWGRKQWADYDPVKNGDYAGSCLPFGWSRNINSPHGTQILQNNDAISFMFEQNTWHTWVPTSATFKWPTDLPRTWNGTSVGRWEGDTLIIETTNFNGYTRLDTTGHPHSKDAKFINTFLRTDSNTIQHTVTVHDPKAYTKDWMNVRVWNLKPANDVLMEYSCEENNLGLEDGAIAKWKFPETVD